MGRLRRIVYDQGVREKGGRTGFAPRAHREPTETLLGDLEREARRSPDGEAYRELVRVPGCRLGLTATLASRAKVAFIVDVLVERSPCAATIEAALVRRGYASTRLDDGWVAHERSVTRGRLAAEWRFLRGLLGSPEGSP